MWFRADAQPADPSRVISTPVTIFDAPGGEEQHQEAGTSCRSDQTTAPVPVHVPRLHLPPAVTASVSQPSGSSHAQHPGSAAHLSKRSSQAFAELLTPPVTSTQPVAVSYDTITHLEPLPLGPPHASGAAVLGKDGPTAMPTSGTAGGGISNEGGGGDARLRTSTTSALPSISSIAASHEGLIVLGTPGGSLDVVEPTPGPEEAETLTLSAPSTATYQQQLQHRQALGRLLTPPADTAASLANVAPPSPGRLGQKSSSGRPVSRRVSGIPSTSGASSSRPGTTTGNPAQRDGTWTYQAINPLAEASTEEEAGQARQALPSAAHSTAPQPPAVSSTPVLPLAPPSPTPQPPPAPPLQHAPGGSGAFRKVSSSNVSSQSSQSFLSPTASEAAAGGGPRQPGDRRGVGRGTGRKVAGFNDDHLTQVHTFALSPREGMQGAPAGSDGSGGAKSSNSGGKQLTRHGSQGAVQGSIDMEQGIASKGNESGAGSGGGVFDRLFSLLRGSSSGVHQSTSQVSEGGSHRARREAAAQAVLADISVGHCIEAQPGLDQPAGTLQPRPSGQTPKTDVHLLDQPQLSGMPAAPPSPLLSPMFALLRGRVTNDGLGSAGHSAGPVDAGVAGGSPKGSQGPVETGFGSGVSTAGPAGTAQPSSAPAPGTTLAQAPRPQPPLAPLLQTPTGLPTTISDRLLVQLTLHGLVPEGAQPDARALNHTSTLLERLNTAGGSGLGGTASGPQVTGPGSAILPNSTNSAGGAGGKDGFNSRRQSRSGASVNTGGSHLSMMRRNSSRDLSVHGRGSGKGSMGRGRRRRGLLGVWDALKEHLTIPVILPNQRWYVWWFYVTVVTAGVSAVCEPYKIAFETPGLYPYSDFNAIQDILITLVFCVDILLHTRLAYQDEMGNLVTDGRDILRHYIRTMLPLDLLFTIPFTWIVSAGIGNTHGDDGRTALGVECLGLLKLGRLYRLVSFFDVLEYQMVLGQLALLLIRNNLMLFFSCHWFACIFYLIARMEADKAPQFQGSWIGAAWARFDGLPTFQRYLVSLYYSVGCFAGLGDGDLSESTPTEALAMILFLTFNIIAVAYILGTVTMLMVKGDKKAKRFREEVQTLNEFAKTNEVPEALKGVMKEHLELTCNAEQAPDEQVLSCYPTAIRRKVMRHLYGPALSSCPLFRGCSPMFLDAVMAQSRVELFMPKVVLVHEGDIMNELFIVISGHVEVSRSSMQPGLTGAAHVGGGHVAHDMEDRSVRSGRSHSFAAGSFIKRSTSFMSSTGSNRGLRSSTLTTSDVFGDVAFFTEINSPETISSATVVRVLIFSKQAYEALVATFPEQMMVVKDNLRSKAEADMKYELTDALDRAQLSPELMDTITQYTLGDLCPSDMPPEIMQEVKSVLTPHQIRQLEAVDLVKQLVKTFQEKVDRLRIYAFLNSAAAGNLEAIRGMVDKGLSVDCMDYDNRTALMLACHEGHAHVVRYLLEHSADAMITDNFGNTAMFEAVREGKDECVKVMLDFDAVLGVSGIMLAAQMCTYLYEREYSKLRRVLRAGADPDAADYDQRCALHIAAAEGDLEGVRLMVEEGGAQVDFRDRWGHSACDEARRVGAAHVVSYLEPLMKLANKGQICCSAKPKAPTFSVLRARRPELLLEAGLAPDYIKLPSLLPDKLSN